MAAVADGYVQTEALPPVLVLHATEAAPSTLQFRPTGSNGSHVGHDNSINGGGTAANSDAEQSSDPEPDKEQDYENGMDVNDENATPDDDAQASGGDRKPRRELPPATVKILKDWMLSTEHIKHPYPTDDDKKKLLETTGINMKQLTNWFTNARKRIWKPMMRREHSRQLQTSLDIEASSGTAALPIATDSTASYSQPPYDNHHHHHHHRGYNEFAYDQGHHSPHPMMERRLSMPSSSAEFDPRHHPQVQQHHTPSMRRHQHPLASISTPGGYHGHQAYPTPSTAPMSPYALPRMLPPSSSFFPPRCSRSASESVAHRHAPPLFAMPTSRSSTQQQPPPPPIPARLERTKDAPSPPQKRTRPSSTGDAENADDPGKDTTTKRLRRSALLPPHVIKILKDWMLSPEHVEHPYPTDLEKKQLCDETGLDLCQLNNWFANNRKRLWKPTMANRSKALYTNENIRNLIYKTDHNSAASSSHPPPASHHPANYQTATSVNSVTGFKSERTFRVNANLARPPVGGPDSVPSSFTASQRYPFPRAPVSQVTGMAPREGRSHTLDMGHFRRNRMNFQDVLNATPSPSDWNNHHPDGSFMRRGSGGGGTMTLPSLHTSSSAAAAGFHGVNN